ncbi:uncharacterized protein SPSK_08164 [Sporothrix schenckii 1099-18]|uniref:Uncharacterized protein n=1 Tax=Sporothrix schenckii 1099-18 TaxID=1397361 RepID=A0A0F2MHV5_SPOSC|nr:uncharacterized protein SPSK_08164 [Sporothrix schenckii 1099-18]KJR87756.1 hypothetical protein SPSK_08164 [Sporothrix schenckii 1099-18]
MGFTLEEMKMVHARLSDLIAASSQELTQTTGVLDFVAGIDTDTQQQLASAASSVRGRRGRKAVLSAEEETAENLRLYAEIEAKMGRAWMKKYDLQESKRLLEAKK